jgi:hypothetical protein
LPTTIRKYQLASTIPPSFPTTARFDATEVTMTGVGTLLGREDPTDSFKWLRESLVFPPNLKNELRERPNFIAVSDGSFKQEHGSSVDFAITRIMRDRWPNDYTRKRE